MKLYVAAGGNGTRMRSAIEELGFGDLPKHLLPIDEDGGSSLIEKNLQEAMASSHEVSIIANDSNQHIIEQALGHLSVPVQKQTGTNPLGPFSFTEFMTADETAASIAGDVFIDGTDWEGFLVAHRSSSYPVSLLVAQVNGKPTNAVFDVSPTDGKIERFHRLVREKTPVYRNVGMYAVTFTPDVIEIAESFAHDPPGQEDRFATRLVEAGLARAHLHEGAFFNINTLGDYRAMLAHTSSLVGNDTQTL